VFGRSRRHAEEKAERERRLEMQRWKIEREEASHARGQNRTMIAVSVVGLVLTAVGVLVAILAGEDSDARRPQAKTQPPLTTRAASTQHPPVLIESVGPLVSNTGDGSFALPQRVALDDKALTGLGHVANASPDGLAQWAARRDGAALDFGLLSVTVRGNAGEPVRLVDLRPVKTCKPPLTGTYFKGYSQGSGDTVKIGIDLDQADPIAQSMARTTARGLFPLGDNFFATTAIQLAPEETETLTIGVFTKSSSCEFRLRLYVATVDGQQYETIDNHGEPLRLTATARPVDPDKPYSAYSSAYVSGPDPQTQEIGWRRVNPLAYDER
jgi:hypothetical protein